MKHSPRTRARRLAVVGGVAGAALAGLAMASPASAAQPAAGVSNGTLTVTGSENADSIALRLQAAAPGLLQVDFGDDGTAEFTFDRANFTRINVLAGGGADQFRVDQVSGTFADEIMTVEGGPGNDILNGGDGVETFVGGSGNDTVDGNRGNDTGVLNSGDDTFRWDPGDGSDIVEGNTGFDTLDFNGAGAAEVMSLSANGSRSVFLRDVAAIRMDMGGVERLDLTALGGTDSVTINDMSGTQFRQADVDLSVAGAPDGAADTITVNGTARRDNLDVTASGTRVDVTGLQTGVALPGSESIDSLQINTLDGKDQVDVAGVLPITLNVDLGAGQI